MMPFDPGLPARADFLLPHRNDLLDAVDAVTRRLEDAAVAVGGRAGDDDRRRPGVEPADTLDQGDPFDARPASADFLGHLAALGLGHRRVGLVLEALRHAGRLTVAFAAYHPREN